MKNLRPWIACCTAIALLAAALPVPAAKAGPAADGEPAACHAAGPAPTSHNDRCAQGCDSAPLADGAGPDWAHQTVRQPDLDAEPGSALIPAYRLEFKPVKPPRIDATPRASPGHFPATPVGLCDRMLN
jgi:hypothetical protein